MRKLVLALFMAVLAVLSFMAPASAAPEVTSVQAASEVGVMADGVNFAVAGTLPPRSQLTCNSFTEVEICYEKGGDHWWVQDQDSGDKSSAGVLWTNFRDGSLYRTGACITSLGEGNWGHCNKNYYEDSELYGFPCKWNRSANEDMVCRNSGHRYQ